MPSNADPGRTRRPMGTVSPASGGHDGVMQFVDDVSPTAGAPLDHRLSMRLLARRPESDRFRALLPVAPPQRSGPTFDAAAFAGSLAVNPSDLGGNDLKLMIGPTLILALAALVLVIGAKRRRFLLGVAAAVAAAVAVGVTKFLKHAVFTTHVRGHHQCVPERAYGRRGGLCHGPDARHAVELARSSGGGRRGVRFDRQRPAPDHQRPIHQAKSSAALLLAFATVTGVAGLLRIFQPVEHQALRYEGISLVLLGAVGTLAAGTTGVALAHGFGRLPIALLPGIPLSRLDLNDFVAGASLSVMVVTALMATLLLLLRGTQFGGPARSGAAAPRAT